MIFGKYHIVIFRDGKSGSRNIRFHGALVFLLGLLILALFGVTVWLFLELGKARGVSDSLRRTELALEDERKQTVNLAASLADLGRDLDRIRRFDNKLRLMMNMDREPAETGDGDGDYSRFYLPLHRQEVAVRKMREFISSLAESAHLEEVRQQDLLLALRENRSLLTSIPSIWPVTGFISSSFGSRISPFGRGSQFHKGLDISNRVGTPVIAPAEGTVIKAAHDGAYGNSVEIDHGGGIVSKYAHLQKAAVQPGQWIKRGQVLGYVGMTGRTTGPHLHYEVRLNGLPVNPMRYILN